MSDNVALAVAYYTNGVNFRVSAERLASDLELDNLGRPTKLTAIPLFFLASHAAELFLKAALLKRGVSSSDLKKFEYRHNLSALLQLLQLKNIFVSAETIELVNGLSEQHAEHALRYTVLFDDGKKTYWPPIALVFSALEELLLLTRVGNNSPTSLPL
ncbi:hypothetical protein [Nitrosomonas ureae]|uniref:HEPN domain-containing protein n=1 Tax=Nitrosomonas ureae TaxID=44577 RepID=A0A286AKV9_9PROT|nr:hypothetical protein [Nitrosomonas ureae]SOD22547.1 hypothetical protein SAMN06297164_3504 [Nitrosomonas ureae]